MRLGRGDTPFCGYNVGAARHDALDGMHAMVASGDGYFSEYVTQLETTQHCIAAHCTGQRTRCHRILFPMYQYCFAQHTTTAPE